MESYFLAPNTVDSVLSSSENLDNIESSNWYELELYKKILNVFQIYGNVFVALCTYKCFCVF